MPQAWFLHNPAAGRFPADSLVRRSASVFSDHGWTVRLETAGRREDLTEKLRAARERAADAVIVAGGDGTVGLAASVLRGSDTALGVLPTGTANVWGRELGLPGLSLARPGGVDEVAGALAQGVMRPVDLGEVNGRAFLLWAGTGLDARVVHMVEPRHRIDKVLPTTLYLFHTLRSAQRWQGVELDILWPEGRISGRFMLGVACNIGSYGGGLLRLAPEARVDDGILDFWILEGHTVVDTVVRLVQIARGEHVGGPGFQTFRAREAEFRGSGSLPMHFDGEPGVLEAPLRFRVLEKDLRVLTPVRVPQGLFASAPAPERALA